MTTWLPSATKSMFLVWGDPTALLEEGLRDALAATGCRRLQVNVDDAHVAGALRFGTGEQVTAVVSTWDGAPAPVLGDAVRCAGWVVDERRRLDPAETYAGERADALANIAVLRRPAELDRETWLQRWLVDHTPIAIRTQATTAYVQNICLAALTADPPRVDGLVEELFPSAALVDPHAFYGSGGDDAELGRRMSELMASVARIGADRDLDLVPTSRHLWDLQDR